jgi:hypothetical protein
MSNGRYHFLRWRRRSSCDIPTPFLLSSFAPSEFATSITTNSTTSKAASSTTTTPTSGSTLKQNPSLCHNKKKESSSIGSTITSTSDSVSVPWSSTQIEDQNHQALRFDGQRYFLGYHQWTQGRMRHPRHQRIGQEAWTLVLPTPSKHKKHNHSNEKSTNTNTTTTREQWLVSTPLHIMQQSSKNRTADQLDKYQEVEEVVDDNSTITQQKENLERDDTGISPTEGTYSTPEIPPFPTTNTTITHTTLPTNNQIWLDGLDRSVTRQMIVEYFQTQHGIPVASLRFQSSTAAVITLIHPNDVANILRLNIGHPCPLGQRIEIMEYTTNTKNVSSNRVLSSSHPEDTLVVRLGNIPPDTHWRMLRDFLERVVGAVKSVHISIPEENGTTTARAMFWNTIQVQYAMDTIPSIPFPGSSGENTHGSLTITREPMIE